MTKENPFEEGLKSLAGQVRRGLKKPSTVKGQSGLRPGALFGLKRLYQIKLAKAKAKMQKSATARRGAGAKRTKE
jgi:hypothetical protein